MGQHHDHRTMPAFRDPQGTYYSLPIKPPFAFEGMTARVFPLRANLDSVQRFVNGYLNIVPGEVGRFRAVVPYVYLMMLDYGKLALEVSNLGWLAQREIMFCVPLEWYKVVDGAWVFHDWATISPFIYVDDDLSMNLGRTVYGWPKTIARLTPSLTEWMVNPEAPVSEATVSTLVFPELYHGRRLESRVFLEVQRRAPAGIWRYPFDADHPAMPWTVASNVADAMAGFGRDLPGMLAGLGIVPQHDGSTSANFSAMMDHAVRAGFPLRPDLSANTLNLKQFRRAENPANFCFQALTNGPMRFTALNRMGLLGEERIVLGDVSGGYRLRLHDWPSLPIVETLGIEVARRWRGSEVDAVEVRPVLPFWYDCNMEYLQGVNLARRGHDGIWIEDSTGRRFPDEGMPPVEPESLLFNTTLGATTGALSGPFRFFDTNVRVLPLLARTARLQEYLDAYLNEALESGYDRTIPASPEAGESGERVVRTRERFRVWTPEGESHAHVYLTATSIGNVTSKTNNVGDWADYEMSFLVPVRRERQSEKGDAWETVGVGVVPAFTYVDDTTAAASRTEVLGIPTNRAEFEVPPNPWMDGGEGAQATASLLRVAAEILPAVGEGQESEMRTLVEVRSGEPERMLHPASWQIAADRWGDEIRDELGRRKALASSAPEALCDLRALALEVLGNHTPVAFYTLKQFRDVPDPDRACYQAVICIARSINQLHDLREIEAPLVVRIHEFPTQPIVGLLGLIGENISEDAAGVVWALQPIRPFEMRVTLDEHLGERMLSRCGSHEWQCNADTLGNAYLENESGIAVGPGLVALQDSVDPRRVEKATRFWNDLVALASSENGEPEDSNLRRLTAVRARNAIDALDPQVVIEQMLSREWANWSPTARWVQGRDALIARYADAVRGIEPEELPAVTERFLAPYLASVSTRPGENANRLEMRRALGERWVELLQAGERLRKHTGVLARLGLWGAQPPAAMKTQTNPDMPAVTDAFLGYLGAVYDVARLAMETRTMENTASSLDLWSRLSDLQQNGLAHVRDALTDLQKILRSDPARAASAWDIAMLPAWNAREAIREAGSLALGLIDRQQDAVFTHLARDWQKPDFVVRRDMVGPERERIFPRAQSWDDVWYAGPSRDLATTHQEILAEQRAEARRTRTPVATTAIKDPDAG